MKNLKASHTALLFDVSKMPLTKEESTKLRMYIEKAGKKYNLTPNELSGLETLYESTFKHFKAVKNAFSAITSDDIDVFRDIAIIATTKAYAGNILEYIASVQPVDNPFGQIYVTRFYYADDYPDEGITAGTELSEKRTKGYAKVGEEVRPRRIKSQTRAEQITCEVRKIEMSETLEAVLSLKSIYGEAGAQEFLNKTYLDVVASKLRDEMELYVIDLMNANVPAENVVGYSTTSPDATDCVNSKCHAQRLFDAIEEAADRVYSKTGVRPNTIIVGSKAMSILRRGEFNIVRYNREGLPISVARTYIGVIEDTFNVVYEPSVDGIILTYKHPTNPVESAVIYAPHVPLGMTPTIVDRDLSFYRTVYSIDAAKVVYPELLAKVEIV